MSSTAKYVKYDSAVDSIISIIRRSYIGKKVDEEFLSNLKSLMENKIDATSAVIEQATAPMKVVSVMNTELECLPLPNEILVKIFGYLDFQDISRSARVSHQFNMISKDSSLWKSLGKLYIEGMKVPTEFLKYVVQRGITELCLVRCEILPPMKQPLNLRALGLHLTTGDKKFVNEILTTHSMEKIDFSEDMISDHDISQFIKKLPEIGGHLKNLNLENTLPEECGDLEHIELIVDSCVGLEELNLCANILTGEAIDYLCENLTPNILKLNLGDAYIGLINENIIKLVERCPNLKVLDIRSNEEVTYHGLVAITEGLNFLEYLGLPNGIAEELGLPSNVNLPKLRSLKSLKKLKGLLIGDQDIWDIIGEEYHSFLRKEIPHLRKYTGKGFPHDLEVARMDTKDFIEVLKI